MNAITEIKRFQTDRGLDKIEYSAIDAHLNIIEELLESLGYDVPKKNRSKLEEPLFDFIGVLLESNSITDIASETSSDEKVDAYADIIVFAIGEIMKLGYEPEEVLLEVSKEINSREGEFINGKFEKHRTKEYTDKWYKASFDNCRSK